MTRFNHKAIWAMVVLQQVLEFGAMQEMKV